MRTVDPSRPPWIAIVAAIAIVLGIKVLFVWVLVPIGVERGLLPGGGAVRDMYYDIAVNLAAGDGYRVVPTEGETMMRGPGYVYFLAGLIRLFGSSLTPLILANLVLSAGTMGIVIMLTHRITSSYLLGVLCAVVAGLHPGVMFMDARLNVESFFTFFLCVFVLLLYLALAKDRLRDYVFAGLALGFVSLSRSSPFFMLPFLFLYLLFVHRGSRPLVRATTLTAVTGLTALLVLSPWMARNYSIAGKPTFSENLVGIAAFQGQYTTRAMGHGKSYAVRVHDTVLIQREIAAREGVACRPWFERNQNWAVFPTVQDELRYNKVLLAEAMGYYQEDWTLLPRHCLINSFRFWFIGTTPKVTLVGSVVQVPLMSLALIGIVIGFRQRLRIMPMLLVMFTLYAVHIPLVSHARYATPLVPFLVILAGIAVAWTPLPAWARRRWGFDRIAHVGGRGADHPPAAAVGAGEGGLQTSDRSASYFHYFDFGLGKYIDGALLRVRGEVFDRFMAAFTPEPGDSILDIGVSADDHVSSNYLEKHYRHLDQVTALSIDNFPELEAQFPGLTFVQGDARSLPFPDDHFDYVYSHAVIEHVGDSRNQSRFIKETSRVARKGVLFSTPNRWHPLETHTGLPVLHFLPAKVYRRIYELLGKRMYASEELLNLLSLRQIRGLIAGCSLDDWDVSYSTIRWLGRPSNIVVTLRRRSA